MRFVHTAQLICDPPHEIAQLAQVAAPFGCSCLGARNAVPNGPEHPRPYGIEPFALPINSCWWALTLDSARAGDARFDRPPSIAPVPRLPEHPVVLGTCVRTSRHGAIRHDPSTNPTKHKGHDPFRVRDLCAAGSLNRSMSPSPLCFELSDPFASTKPAVPRGDRW